MTLICVLAGCSRERSATIETEPAGATVWVDSDVLGVTPLQVRVPKEGGLKLRISHTACEDWEAILTAADLPAHGRLRVKLTRKQPLALVFLSEPPGAEVFLDGEYRGRTPITLEDLEPGPAEVDFRMEGRQQETRTVVLDTDDAAATVEVALRSLAAGYYRQEIASNPQRLQNYADLAHHYVVEKEFAEATAVFAQGLDVVLEHPGTNDSRFWQEIQRVIQRQYAYGSSDDVKHACSLVRGMLQKALAKHPQGRPELYGNYVLVLDVLGERDEAQKAMTEALQKFPGNKQLRQMKKQRRL